MKIAPEKLSLYAVTDRRWLNGRSLEAVVEEVIAGGTTIVQLREKHLDDEAFIEEARSLKALCGRYGVPLIINDNIQVAMQTGCGLHVGQGDAPMTLVRRRMGDEAVIGVSCTTVQQAVQAELEGADYLGVGAMFPTGTKDDAEAVSVDELRAICRAVTIPVVAIGGITLTNALSLKDAGIAGVAVVSALFAAKNPRQAASEFRRIF